MIPQVFIILALVLMILIVVLLIYYRLSSFRYVVIEDNNKYMPCRHYYLRKKGRTYVHLLKDYTSFQIATKVIDEESGLRNTKISIIRIP